MRGELLLDASALVAILDRSERHHVDCAAVLEAWEGPIVSTEAVLTEALYLTNANPEMQQDCINFFIREAFVLMPSNRTSLERVASLMSKYKDLPMDFADGTLVCLGEELETNTVFTLDRRGFAVYRLNSKKPFEIFP